MNHPIVKFEIPYRVEVADGIEPSDNGPVFLPQVFGHPIRLAFEKTSGDSGIGGTVTVKRDRLGKATRSKVEATVHRTTYENIPAGGVNEIPGQVAQMGSGLDDREGRMIKIVLKALNKFLQHYREKTAYHWIRPLVVEDIISFRVKTDARGFRDRNVTGAPMKLGGAGWTENEAKELDIALREDQPPNVYLGLHLDVLDKLDLDDRRPAMILSFNLFETWCKNAFITAMVARGTEPKDARETIMKDDGRYYQVYNIMDDYYPKIGVEFSEYERFDEWYDDFYDIRNKIIHEGYLPDEDEIRNGHEECQKAIQYLQSQLENELNGSPEDVEFITIRESDAATRHN